jgi:hypothetical protein
MLKVYIPYISVYIHAKYRNLHENAMKSIIVLGNADIVRFYENPITFAVSIAEIQYERSIYS